MRNIRVHIDWKMIICLAAWAIVFCLLDSTAISLGDDLGYMFTDSTLHNGDGHRVASLSDCVTTQLSHYVTTNGRFIVHLVVQILVSLLPHPVFIILNGLMFALLAYLVSAISFPQRAQGWKSCALSGCLLWLFTPDPGLIMLSLVAFAVNYMWVAVAVLWFISSMEKVDGFSKNGCVLFCFASILTGSLQESYSLPVSAALAVSIIFGGKAWRSKKRVISSVAFMIGTAVVTFAPGNFRRLSSGTGDLASDVIRNIKLLDEYALHTSLILLIITIIITLVWRKKYISYFFKRHGFICVALVFALLMDMAVLNASRQFWAAAIFSIILLLGLTYQLVSRLYGIRRYFNYGLLFLPVTFLLLGAAMFLRIRTYNDHCELIRQFALHSRDKNVKVFMDCSDCNYNIYSRLSSLLRGYAPDPWQRNGFYCSLDPITQRGFCRLYFNKDGNLDAVFPYPRAHISGVFKNCKSDQSMPIVRLDSVYSALRLPAGRDTRRLRIENTDESVHYLQTAVFDEGDFQYAVYVTPPCGARIFLQ
ncbi:MAG: hypothetical protein J6L73_08405 [Muribaculaceae bacterium]|nr:hypothetical protein [Muribaculaceae bacterium]